MPRPFRFLSYILITGWTVAIISGLKIKSPESLKALVKHDVLHVSHHVPREQLRSVIGILQLSRPKRDAGCPQDKVITKDVLDSQLLPVDYSPEELRVCLEDKTLRENLAILTTQPFTDEQMKVLKSQLDRMFPAGYPEEILCNLGGLSELMTAEDVKSWKITNSTTLAALLQNQFQEPLPSMIIKQYTDNVNQVNAEALNAIGSKYICSVNKDQLKMISEEAIKMAEPLDVSHCNQTTLNTLYPIAKRAWSDHHLDNPLYFNMIKPFIRGAPAEDLKALSKQNVTMDVPTLQTLPKETLMKLTLSEVKGLLGTNTGDLKNYQNVPPISEWIQKQKRDELVSLGLTGGRQEGYINIMRVKDP